MKQCPCCSGKSYQDCCKTFHTKTKFPQTAEELMRSRFSAFAIPNGEYLMDTTFPAKRKLHNKKDLQEWGEINEWTKLEIIKSTLNQVEFEAFYIDEKGIMQIHHEISDFQQIEERWHYVKGKFLD